MTYPSVKAMIRPVVAYNMLRTNTSLIIDIERFLGVLDAADARVIHYRNELRTWKALQDSIACPDLATDQDIISLAMINDELRSWCYPLKEYYTEALAGGLYD